MHSRIIRTDCLSGFTNLSTKVSAIITSPPYNVGIKYNGSNVDNDKKINYLEWMQNVFTVCKNYLLDDGHFFLQVGGIATHPTIPFELLAQAISTGFVLQNEIIWVKNISLSDKAEDSYGHFKPIPSNRLLNNTHEFIFHLTKNGKIPVDRLAVGVPLKYKSNVTRFKHTKDLRCRGNVWFIPYDTIQHKKDRYDHPATFPVALPEMCIKLSGIPIGSLVIDPFAGTGTTLVACEKLGMCGIGFDVSEYYCKIAEQRISAFS